ncbi:transcriptional regulator [Sphingomonas sp. 1P06PA]|uniref:winged helix-turn-helix domain-containing protein n=1 Tax=Sphingomonas sp. 1P06PA TaxID=554121 RepID=UPI0039A527CD
MADRKAPYAYEGLDRIFHEKARLGIVTSLAGHSDGLGFSDLKSLCGLTDGNLSRHLQVLEDAGFVALEKGYEGKRPHTRCRLTTEGRERFADYLDVLAQVLRKARAGARSSDGAPRLSGRPT